MKNDLSCSVVQDLLPNYIENLTGKETNEIMEAHLMTCKECQKVRDEMLGQIETEKVPEVQDMKRFLNKTKKLYVLKGILWSIGILAILVCFIVDFTINRRLTWSLIVDISIIYVYACGFTAVYSNKKRFIKTLGMASVLLLPLLYGFEFVIRANYQSAPAYWVKDYALSISLVWLGIIWAVVLIKYVTKMNTWYTSSLFLFFTVFGSLYTNALGNNTTMLKEFTNNYEWIDTLAYLGCAILCFVVGYSKKRKNSF